MKGTMTSSKTRYVLLEWQSPVCIWFLLKELDFLASILTCGGLLILCTGVASIGGGLSLWPCPTLWKEAQFNYWELFIWVSNQGLCQYFSLGTVSETDLEVCIKSMLLSVGHNDVGVLSI